MAKETTRANHGKQKKKNGRGKRKTSCGEKEPGEKKGYVISKENNQNPGATASRESGVKVTGRGETQQKKTKSKKN